MTTSIVIPVYSRFDLLHQLLYDIYKNCSLVEEVIVVDNGNEDKYPDVLSGLAWWQSTHMLPIEIIHLKENVGFLKASNIGLKQAVENRIILISTDVRIHKDIISYKMMDDDLWGGRLLDWDTGWNNINGVIYSYIEGWILDTWKENWEKIGFFDERFAPHDCEDLDFSISARKLGITLTTYPEGYVSHLGAQTIGYGEERENITKVNKKKLEEKWSQIQ